MPQFSTSDILLIMWSTYAAVIGVYALSYIIWGLNCGRWFNSVHNGTRRVALTASKAVIRNYRWIKIPSAIAFGLFAITILTNILMVDNSMLFEVMLIIAVPLLIVGLVRMFMGIKASRMDIDAKDLNPRRLFISASMRKDGFDDGTYKLD